MKRITLIIMFCLSGLYLAAQNNLSDDERAEIAEHFNAGQTYYYKNKDYNSAFREYKQAADKGLAGAQYKVAMCYLYGEGVSVNISEYAKYLKLSVEQDWPEGYCAMGTCYFQGLGVPRDLQESFKWYMKSANSNNKDGMYYVALAYHFGEGTEKNIQTAMKWYKKSADLGHGNSAFNLALIYASGQDFAVDMTKSFKWLKVAAENGSPNAMTTLGDLYMRGSEEFKERDSNCPFFPKDKTIALKYYKAAAELGFKEAIYKVAELTE